MRLYLSRTREFDQQNESVKLISGSLLREFYGFAGSAPSEITRQKSSDASRLNLSKVVGVGYTQPSAFISFPVRNAVVGIISGHAFSLFFFSVVLVVVF